MGRSFPSGAKAQHYFSAIFGPRPRGYPGRALLQNLALVVVLIECLSKIDIRLLLMLESKMR